MGDHDDPYGGTTCEACLDWRIEQSESVGAHVAGIVRRIVTDLGFDPINDERVRTIVQTRIREASAGPA